MRLPTDDTESTEIQMGPLIDCVFLLLVFFIVIAVTKKSIKELGIVLPEPGQAVTSLKPKDKDLVLRVTQDGRVWVGDAEQGRQGVISAIREARNRDPNTKVRFEIDHRAQFKHLYPIMDQLKFDGLTDWSFRVHMEEG
jgi:biopolymer transport protein ExbD